MSLLLLARRRGGASGGGGGGGWSFPNAGGGVLGPGANAPAWSGKTIYSEETFATPLTTSERNGGFRFYSGFQTSPPSGSQRVLYPTVVTPIGTKPCIQLNSYGQTEFLSGVSQMTTPWEFSSGFNDVYRAAVFTKGTWSGILIFESSSDGGVSWAPIPLGASPTSGGTHVTGTSTTVNGVWNTPGDSGAGLLLRVRASSWTSGTAEVRVGQIGGYATADFLAGRFIGGPSRIYNRVLHRVSSNWTDGENTGTKGPFWSQISDAVPAQRTNHFMYMRMNGFGLQGNVFAGYDSLIPPPADGTWLDCEQIIAAGTPGNSDGTVEMWINGVKHISEMAVPIIPSTKAAELTSIYHNPAYGGGGRPVPQHQWHEFSNFYRESAP